MRNPLFGKVPLNPYVTPKAAEAQAVCGSTRPPSFRSRTEASAGTPTRSQEASGNLVGVFDRQVRDAWALGLQGFRVS